MRNHKMKPQVEQKDELQLFQKSILYNAAFEKPRTNSNRENKLRETSGLPNGGPEDCTTARTADVNALGKAPTNPVG
jgi:hypothetical protein